MSALQIALLILALAAIALVGFVSHRRNEQPRERRTPRVDDGPDQMDLLAPEQSEGAGRHGAFDEYGVSEPRPRGGGASGPFPEPGSGGDAGAPASSATGGGRPERILSLFVLQPDGQAIPGAEIHRQLHALGLEPGERLTYERRVGDEVWFHVANMRKPGHLDPGEADRFETPGLSLFQLLSELDDPVTAADDLLATAERLAAALGCVLLDEERRALTDEGVAALRDDVRRWAQQHA